MNKIPRLSIVIALGIVGALLLSLVLGLAGVVLWYFRAILFYLLVAAILSLVGRPITRQLSRIRIWQRRLPREVMAILTLLIIYGFFAAVFTMIIPVLLEQIEKLENVDVNSIASSLEAPISNLEVLLNKYRMEMEDVSIEEYIRDTVVGVVQSVRLSNVLNEVLGFIGNFFIALFSITFIAFFFLRDRTLLHRIILTLTPKGLETNIVHVIEQVKPLLSRYFIGLVFELLLVGSLVSLGLGLLGVENAMVIGYMAGLFNVIPYLGPIMGAVLVVGMTLLSNLDLDFYSQMVPLLLKGLLIFLLVQLIDNFVFQPLIYSSSVKAHPLEIFLVILMAGTLAGVGGMIIAIPAYTLIRAIVREFYVSPFS